MQCSPVVSLECQDLFIFFGLVAAIFPAPVSQGAQCSQALWRSQQTADSEKHIELVAQHFIFTVLWRFNVSFSQ